MCNDINDDQLAALIRLSGGGTFAHMLWDDTTPDAYDMIKIRDFDEDGRWRGYA